MSRKRVAKTWTVVFVDPIGQCGGHNLLVGRHKGQWCAMSDAWHMTHMAHRERLTSTYRVRMPPDERGKAFAQLITDARHRKGWRQEDVVAASGISRRNLSRWETGLAERPDPDQVRAVCLALGIDPRLAAVALGYLSPDEVGPVAAQGPPLTEEEQDVLAVLRNPKIPSAEKAPLIEYLRFLGDRRRDQRKTG